MVIGVPSTESCVAHGAADGGRLLAVEDANLVGGAREATGSTVWSSDARPPANPTPVATVGSEAGAMTFLVLLMMFTTPAAKPSATTLGVPNPTSFYVSVVTLAVATFALTSVVAAIETHARWTRARAERAALMTERTRGSVDDIPSIGARPTCDRGAGETIRPSSQGGPT
jgi:hypothetical protein